MSLFYKPPETATEADLEQYRLLREEGYPAWQARIMMGWADPPDYSAEQQADRVTEP